MRLRRPPPPAPRAAPPAAASAALGIFLLAFAFRLLFWQATADRALPYGVGFKGDAPTWLDWATALQRGVPFEGGVPLRPPGTAYLVAWLWDGSAAGIPALRLAWCALGALAVALLYTALRRTFGHRVALLAAYVCSASTGLLLLSSTLDAEVPYLVLVAAGFCLWSEVEAGDRLAVAAWGALQGLACLLRVEHALCAALLLAWLALRRWRGRGFGFLAMRALLAALVAAAALLPWHRHAWQAIARFDDGSERLDDPTAEAAVAAVEAQTAALPWDAAALAERRRLPAAVRRTTAAFVTATVAWRGGREVKAESFEVLDEAFGWRPRPLQRHPFVALYGPLNFYLANRPESGGGFSSAPLAVPPPLVRGAAAYPPQLIAGLPPAGLALSYPPHLRLVEEGYRLGGRDVRRRPAAWVALELRKLAIFWRGASLGLGGWGVPIGLAGLRRSVDLVTAEGAAATLWGLGLLILVALAWWHERRRPELTPWLLYGGSKVLVTLAFFGYARQGALVLPVVALLLALPLERALADAPLRRRLVFAALMALLLAEALRWQRHPPLRVDGRAMEGREPFGFEDHASRRIEVGRR
jgi:hypothetical protein